MRSEEPGTVLDVWGSFVAEQRDTECLPYLEGGES
jgi:hypothetical protein